MCCNIQALLMEDNSNNNNNNTECLLSATLLQVLSVAWLIWSCSNPQPSIRKLREEVTCPTSQRLISDHLAWVPSFNHYVLFLHLHWFLWTIPQVAMSFFVLMCEQFFRIIGVYSRGHLQFAYLCCQIRASLVAQQCRMMQVWFLGREDPLKKDLATHSYILDGKSHGWRSLAG